MDEQQVDFLKGIRGTPVTRRDLMKGALILGASAVVGPTVAACGGTGGGTSASPSALSSSRPKQGGALRVGIVGGSASDRVDPQLANTAPENCNVFMAYDTLMYWDPNYVMVPALAEEWSPNKDCSVWKVKLRQGVVCHDGKPLTADDIVFSFNRIMDPKNPKAGASLLYGLTYGGVRKVDASTVAFHLDLPNAAFDEALCQYRNCVVPANFSVKAPNGTGPFKPTGFLPGQQFTYAANKDYWGEVAHVDTLTVIEFADPVARVNGLTSGTLDAITDVDPPQIQILKSAGKNVLASHTGSWDPLIMRTDVKPFNDVRVRQAFKLIVDRPAMITQAYDNYGSLGNDMYARYDPGTPQLPQRVQDLEQAKSLLKAAGYDNDLKISLMTSDAVGGGAVAYAQVFSEQAKGAGVDVTVNKVDASIIFGDNYCNYTFTQDFFYTRNYLTQVALTDLPKAVYNETHWDNPKWLAIVTEAYKTADKTKRNELIGEAQKIDHDMGGWIVWSFTDRFDGYSEKLGGVVPDRSGLPLSSFHWNKFYFV